MTADLLFWMIMCHFIGDYWLQSDWVAQHKKSSAVVAMFHALLYAVPFAFLVQGCAIPAWAFLVIVLTHFWIDHLGLAKYLCFAKNFLAPKRAWPKWSETNFTGYPAKKDLYITFWLFVITDNSLHLLFNYLALRYL